MNTLDYGKEGQVINVGHGKFDKKNESKVYSSYGLLFSFLAKMLSSLYNLKGL